MHHRTHTGAADILIPVENGLGRIKTLLEEIYHYSDFPFHIYVLDCGPADATADLAGIFTRDITIVRMRKRRNWCGAINHGMAMASNPYLVMLDTDVELAHGWLGNLIAFLETHPRIAAVGPLDSKSDHWQGVDCVREQIVPQIPVFFTQDIHERNRILQFHFEGTGVLVDRPLDFFCAAFARRATDRAGRLSETGSGTGNAEYCRRLRQAGFVLGLSLATYVARRTDSSPAL